jgi:hypothetical protein
MFTSAQEATVTRLNRIKTLLGGLLVLTGVLLAVLPKDWLEETFGLEPDAGSGVLELAIVLVPITAGIVLLTNVFLSQHRHEPERHTSSEP